jgi:hypothetical protein
LYAPAVAGAESTESVGVTLSTIDPAATDVTEAVNGSPVPGAPAFVIETVAPVSKVPPVLVRVTVVAGEPSQIDAGLIELTTGAAFMLSTPGSAAEVPLSSVKVALNEPAAVVPWFVAMLAVPVVELVSTTCVNVTPVAELARLTGPPSSAKPLPVKATVPVPPAPIAAGVVVKPLSVGAVSAPASVAIANGSAAAASKAPAARAFTKWRCIRRGLFMVNSLHS